MGDKQLRHVIASLLMMGLVGACDSGGADKTAVQAVVTAFLQGDVAESRRRQQALLGVYDAMFVESNPGPVKAALAWMGKIPAEIRLPLAWPAEASIAKTLAALRAYGLQGG